MSKTKTITCYVTLTGDIWATSQDLSGSYAVRQDVGGGLHFLLGHFGNIQPRKRVVDTDLADPEDIAGHPFCWVTYDPGDDTTTLRVDAAVVNRFDAAGRFLVGERGRVTVVIEEHR